jgi:hypothetical protein
MKRFWIIFFTLLFFFAGSVVLYVRQALQPALPSQAGLDAIQTSSAVVVREEKYGWSFQPPGSVTRGLAFYPGGLVSPIAYAPLMKAIAHKGYRVALLRMPYNLAVSAQGKAREPMGQNPELNWALGGHSLGGVVAMNFAASNPAAKAVVMWAAYPQGDQSGKDLPTLALFGGQDGLIGQEKIAAEKGKFPQGTVLEVIAGLNHSGFAAYGPQRGDREALIGKEEGWKLVVGKTVEFLNRHLKN